MTPPTQDDLAAGRELELFSAPLGKPLSHADAARILNEQFREVSEVEYGFEIPGDAVVDAPLKCDWCEYEALYSINWECGHASAMCSLCFEPSDARDWTMDLMDWDQVPAICPDCAG